ncbi:putative acetyltransferase [compost metagenome]
MNITFERAKPSEHHSLTNVSFEAKRYWKYPEEYYTAWEKELTITKEYIASNLVYLARVGDEVAGYFSICRVESDFWSGKVFVNKGYWLEHIFIRPEFMGRGIGKELIQLSKEVCREHRIEKLHIFSDPFAKGFYTKIGARYVRESESSIEGRQIPVFELLIT